MKLRLRAIVIVLFLIAGAMAQISKTVVYKHASGKDLKIDSLIPDSPMSKNGYTVRVLFLVGDGTLVLLSNLSSRCVF